jgi:hypothetical protein
MRKKGLFSGSHYSHYSQITGQKKGRPGKGSGNKTKGQDKFTEKNLVTRSFIADYAALLEIYYFDAGNQYRVTAFTKDLDLLENEKELKTFIGSIIAACKVRRQSA